MKYIKNHIMFILPLMAILLSIEFYLVFDRTTHSYEEGLKEGYSMLVVSKRQMSLDEFQALSSHISQSNQVERDEIVSQISKGISNDNRKKILGSLPFFYDLHLDEFIHTDELQKIKNDLEANADIKKVETFGSSYGSNYRLFTFIKFSITLFISFMGMVSLFLIIKQMEIWKYAHKERMQIMEIFGAPMMLRSGILFKTAIVDAIIATLVISGIFLYVKFYWAMKSGIDIMVQKRDELFLVTDISILLGAALFIVIIAVYTVVYSSKGVQE